MWKPGGKGYIYGMVDLEVPGTYSEWFGKLFRAFPDFRFEVLDIVASGEQAAVRWRASGTFNGPGKFEGLEPTGARVDARGNRHADRSATRRSSRTSPTRTEPRWLGSSARCRRPGRPASG